MSANVITIQTLGGFSLSRGGARVGTREWQSKKARDLLKLLIARRGRPAPRDVFIEELWPDEDPRRTANRFSVALSTLRSVLDPDHRFAADHFVVTVGASIRLDTEAVVVDVERFLAGSEEALSLVRRGFRPDALERLEALEAAYEGDFLEEDLYEDWASPLRDEARAAYIGVAGELAEHSASIGSYGMAARYYRRLLDCDPYDERAHVGLVRAYESLRAFGRARRAYRSYLRRMEEIGIEPELLTPAVALR